MTKNGNGKATLEQVISIVNRLEDKMDDILKNHADKIDALESGQSKMFGGIVVIGVVWQWILNSFR
jgi:hypothetical protein